MSGYPITRGIRGAAHINQAVSWLPDYGLCRVTEVFLSPYPEQSDPLDREHDLDVSTISDLFERAAGGNDVSFNVSDAICRLQAHVNGLDARPLSEAQHDRMAAAVILAQDQILDLFETEAEQILAGKAVDGVLGVISSWAGGVEPHNGRVHSAVDCQAYARWLRNACHNHCLIEEIEMRAQGRRPNTMREIIREAIT